MAHNEPESWCLPHAEAAVAALPVVNSPDLSACPLVQDEEDVNDDGFEYQHGKRPECKHSTVFPPQDEESDMRAREHDDLA